MNNSQLTRVANITSNDTLQSGGVLLRPGIDRSHLRSSRMRKCTSTNHIYATTIHNNHTYGHFLMQKTHALDPETLSIVSQRAHCERITRPQELRRITKVLASLQAFKSKNNDGQRRSLCFVGYVLWKVKFLKSFDAPVLALDGTYTAVPAIVFQSAQPTCIRLTQYIPSGTLLV